MKYPLLLNIKIISIALQLSVTDATGELICFVKQKIFKLKEAVTIFSDQSQQKKLCEIKADRVIDFSANYHFTDANGERFGGIRRQGMRSLWKAHTMTLWTKMAS